MICLRVGVLHRGFIREPVQVERKSDRSEKTLRIPAGKRENSDRTGPKTDRFCILPDGHKRWETATEEHIESIPKVYEGMTGAGDGPASGSSVKVGATASFSTSRRALAMR